MKTILVINLLISITLTKISCQENINNFYAEESALIWQKVFETSMSFDELYTIAAESGLLTNVEKLENKLIGELNLIDANYKGAGYSIMSAPIYTSRSFYSAFVILELKEGKYRVTLKKIMLTQKYDDTFTRQDEKTSLEFYGLKKGKAELTNEFVKNGSKILDFTFTQRFDFTKKLNNNW